MDNTEKVDIHQQIIDGIVEVLNELLSVRLQPFDEIPSDSLEKLQNVESVTFSGDAAGSVSIHVGDEFVPTLAASKPEKETAEPAGDEEINNVMAELGNRVASTLESVFTDAGLSCNLSAPSLNVGIDFKSESSLEKAKCERFAFRSAEDIVLIETVLEIIQPDLAAGDRAEDIHDSAPDGETEENKISTEAAAPARTTTRPANDSKEASPQCDFDLELLLDIPLEIKVELGRARIQIQEMLRLAPGSALKLLKLEGEPVDILANDTLIARGEVVVQNEKYGVRVTEITSRIQRIRSFSI